MNTASTPTPMAYADHRPGFFARAEGWLDERGKGAWIAAMVLGFIFVWPVGLALLAYMIWSKRMFNKSNRSCSRRASRMMGGTTGNRAFDAYRAETIRRLEEEQDNFEAFLERLREAKDKSEFDQFMDDRANQASSDLDADEDEDKKEDA